MKMKRTIRLLAVCAALILAILAGAIGSAFAETVITLDGVANSDAAKQRLTGIRISGLTAPAAGQVCDAQAVVTSSEGTSWETPVLWLDATGHVMEAAVKTTKLFPVLVFYLPEGYGMDGLSLTLDDDVAALFSPSVLSICNRKLGVTYIFPGNIDLSGIEGMVSNSGSEAPVKESASRNSIHHQEENDDEEPFIRPVSPKPEPEPEPVDLVDLYCSQTAKDAVSAEDQFGGGTGSCSQDRLTLFHDQNVIQTGFAFTGISDVFKIPGNIFLPVQIIRRHAQVCRTLCACFRIYIKAPCLFRLDDSAIYKTAQKGLTHITGTDNC